MKRFLLLLITASILTLAMPSTLSAEIRLELISQIESSNNPNAYNARSGARGLFQITPVCLLHFNSVHRSVYSLGDLHKPEINKKIAQWYFRWLAKQLKGDDRVLVGFNSGIKKARHWDGNIRTLNRETSAYLFKYRSLLKRERKQKI